MAESGVTFFFVLTSVIIWKGFFKKTDRIAFATIKNKLQTVQQVPNSTAIKLYMSKDM